MNGFLRDVDGTARSPVQRFAIITFGLAVLGTAVDGVCQRHAGDEHEERDVVDVQCTFSVRGSTLRLPQIDEGLAHVTYGLTTAPDEVVLEIYPGWSGDADSTVIPLAVGDVVTFEVSPTRGGVSLATGVSVEGIKGAGRYFVANPRLRISIGGREVTTVGAGTGGRLSQFIAFAELDGELTALTHTTVTWPADDGSVETAQHWGAPYLRLSEPLTIEVLGPGEIDSPARVDDGT